MIAMTVITVGMARMVSIWCLSVGAFLEMSIVVSIQKGTVGIAVAPWFQQTVVPETAAKS